MKYSLVYANGSVEHSCDLSEYLCLETKYCFLVLNICALRAHVIKTLRTVIVLNKNYFSSYFVKTFATILVLVCWELT